MQSTRQNVPRRPLYRGDVVLVMFPFTDLTATKRRPAVVLWAAPDQADFTVAFISSKDVTSLTTGEMALLSTHPEFALSGLTASSKLRAAKLVSLSRSLVTRYLGRLGPSLTADLDRALILALGISTAPYREDGRQDERRRLAALHKTGGTNIIIADLGIIC